MLMKQGRHLTLRKPIRYQILMDKSSTFGQVNLLSLKEKLMLQTLSQKLQLLANIQITQDWQHFIF